MLLWLLVINLGIALGAGLYRTPACCSGLSSRQDR
jgi:hypothetical protein